MFRSFFANRRWLHWSILGSALILFTTWYKVQLDVEINEWFGDFYDMLQQALSAPNSITQEGFFAHVLTFGKIAGLYGLHYLDTGLLYRAIARDVERVGGSLDSEADAVQAAQNLDPTTLDDEGLRQTGVGEAASKIAQHQAVRAVLLGFQREFASRAPGAVLDGRDIGTVVCPDADAKLFVTAEASVRAKRRFLELTRRGEQVTYDEILEMIKIRDARDRGREDSPMRAADDALLLDTTNLDITQAFDAAVELIKRKIGRPGAQTVAP